MHVSSTCGVPLMWASPPKTLRASRTYGTRGHLAGAHQHRLLLTAQSAEPLFFRLFFFFLPAGTLSSR